MRCKPLLAGLFVLSASVLLSGCGLLYPEPDPEMAEEKEGLKFDEEYYAQNAKEYFSGRQYGRARDQWEKQLQKNPGVWTARMGIAYCDYYIGARQVAQRDLKSGHQRLEQAEATFRELWSGELEDDAWKASATEPQWKAALGLAMTQRGLGLVKELQSRLYAQREAALGTANQAEAQSKRTEFRKRQHAFAKQRDEYYASSISLFERLCAMKNASPEAVKQLAELYLITEQDGKAETLFNSYLEMAESTAEKRREAKKNLEKEFSNLQGRQIANEFLDRQLRSNAEKQVAVRVKLAGVSYAKGYDAEQQAKQTQSPKRQRLIRVAAHRHFNQALVHLGRARKLQPERLDLLVKMAQCEGELGLLDSAIDNLDQFIANSARGRQTYDADLNQAFRLKRELELRKRARGK